MGTSTITCINDGSKSHMCDYCVEVKIADDKLS